MLPAGTADDMLRQAVDDALAHLGRPARLTVLVNDPQRHTDSGAVLRALARRLDLGACRILVATGSHSYAPHAREAFEKAISSGAGGTAGIEMQWHDGRASDLVAVGHGDAQWRCNRWLLDGPAVLAIGSVEPHYFAGFTGAHKTATIGCAAVADIQSNHAHALSPDSRPCRLEGNPVYDGVAGMLAGLRDGRRVAAINLVQAGRSIAVAAGGEPIDALKLLLPKARELFVRRIDRQADVVVAEVTGPLGESFYQADKGIKNCEWGVRDGGAMILLAPCAAGIGQSHFVELLRETQTHGQALDVIRRRGYRLGDHKALRLRRLTDPLCRNVAVYVVSYGLSEDQTKMLGLRKVASRERALAMARERAGGEVVTVADAGNVCLMPPES